MKKGFLFPVIPAWIRVVIGVVLAIFGTALIVFGIVLIIRQISQPDLVQQESTYGQVKMVPATIPVELRVQEAVARTLAVGAEERGIFTYAITDVTHKDGYYYVSVAGLQESSTRMRWDDMRWLGLVTLIDQPDLPGMVQTQLPTTANSLPEAAGSVSAAERIVGGGSQNILPFRDGTRALYGVKGVHDCGFTLNGWKAVDFFPEENMVYASREGSVSYVCRDDHQMTLRIGNNLYSHLKINGIYIGDNLYQGQAISEMVPGTYDDVCGGTYQEPEQYHVHFCFIPDSNNVYSADGYSMVATRDDGIWTKIGTYGVAPGQYMIADWANAGVNLDNPGPQSNFWDSLVGGLSSMAIKSMSVFPEHQDMHMSKTVMVNISPAIQLINLIFGQFDMTVPLWVMGIIFALESVRIIYAGYMWVRKALPW